tara:strand:- start:195 stop:656 length:462 start_codon:yes stop_codon:yes gene_type:complete
LGLERAILTRIKTQIGNVNGSGVYTADLSGSDRVVIGESFSPGRIPCAYIYPNGVNTAQTPGRTVLSRYDRTMSVQIEAWTAATSSAPGTALLDALDLQDDIMRALESDRSLGGNVRDLEISASSFDGHELDRPGLGFTVLLCSISYTETAGG